MTQVGRGVLPIAVSPATKLSLAHRHRGQAPSHILIGVSLRIAVRHRHPGGACFGPLPREGGSVWP
jgi:hypothetical protein